MLFQVSTHCHRCTLLLYVLRASLSSTYLPITSLLHWKLIFNVQIRSHCNRRNGAPTTWELCSTGAWVFNWLTVCLSRSLTDSFTHSPPVWFTDWLTDYISYRLKEQLLCTLTKLLAAWLTQSLLIPYSISTLSAFSNLIPPPPFHNQSNTSSFNLNLSPSIDFSLN